VQWSHSRRAAANRAGAQRALRSAPLAADGGARLRTRNAPSGVRGVASNAAPLRPQRA
jgi:hypothetical protein